MRPHTLDDYVGQQHLIGPNGVLRRAVEQQRLPSLILWGPPGVGKTTLAGLLARRMEVQLYTLSAIQSGVKEVREVIENARKNRLFNPRSPILFIDELHRFSKSQQDSLLGAVEQGIVTLIGATTENPSFEIIPALLSRCQVYVLEPLSTDDLRQMVTRALREDEILKTQAIEVQEWEALLRLSGGDGRRLYNVLELVAAAGRAGQPLLLTDELVQQQVQQHLAVYDKGGEAHYDLASALIKSIRGSDPNAAVYYLARMIDGGEDPLFIARRLVISAAEDVGLANPNALLLATAAFQAVQQIGMPEGRIVLSEAALYLATSPKSNSAYAAINEALAVVQQTGSLPVPLPLRNAPTRLMKDLGYGRGHQYAHDFEGNFVNQPLLPEALSGRQFFAPQDNPAEARIRERLRELWKERYGY